MSETQQDNIFIFSLVTIVTRSIENYTYVANLGLDNSKWSH